MNKDSQGGFSLVEAMVATALMGVGFSGAFTLTGVSRNASDEAVARQKMQMVANQILEVIESDVENLDSYDMDLETCIEPAIGEMDKFDNRQYEWCGRLNAEIGTVGATETREINITTLADNRRVVHITLEGGGGEVQLVMKRTYDPAD